jgi:zinc and cadmium transporter
MTKGGGWAVLTGDSVHCFGDGILIASAFIADLRLGVMAALAVLAHEVPHHMGDLMVLRQTSRNRGVALVKVSLAGAVTALGGMAGLLPGGAAARLPAVLSGGGQQQLCLCGAGRPDPAAAKAPERAPDGGADRLAAGGHCLVTLVSGLAHAH